MPFCRKCGKEYEEGVIFCSSCEADLLGQVETTYGRRRDPAERVTMGLGRGDAAFIAFILLMTGLGLLLGGFSVLMVHNNFADSEGFTSKPASRNCVLKYFAFHITLSRNSVDSLSISNTAIEAPTIAGDNEFENK